MDIAPATRGGARRVNGVSRPSQARVRDHNADMLAAGDLPAPNARAAIDLDSANILAWALTDLRRSAA
jgi:hypothetical protein